jgi:hypothetical protein
MRRIVNSSKILPGGSSHFVAPEAPVNRAARREYVRAVRPRYTLAPQDAKRAILDEFCATTGYHRKYAIALLNNPKQRRGAPPRRRQPRYSEQAISILASVWEAAGYPWSARLQALLPLWLPWARRRFAIPLTVEQALRTMSPSTMDRRLQPRKRQARRRLYGRTKPGTLLKHHIPIRTEHWDVKTPGFTEVDLVSHSGNWADGDFLQSLNLTDIHTGWVESRAIRGKTQRAVRAALEALRAVLPFPLRGLDSDNGSEFINTLLLQYCRGREIAFTRGRPYKKDDNAHVEQKNWTHVRKLLGWDRYDSLEAETAINDLYRNELRLMMNLFQPSVKLLRKTRVGARVTRRYDRPQTPLDRLLASGQGDAKQLRALRQLRARLDPFTLSTSIDRKLERIHKLANRRHSPRAGSYATPALIDPRFNPNPRHWDHGWLFAAQRGRRAAASAAVRS